MNIHRRKHYRVRRAQSFVFFLVSFGTVFLLCGLALDSGLFYLAKARMSRACDAAVVAGVSNFTKGRDEVANIMRNVAIANYSEFDIQNTTVQQTEQAFLKDGQWGTNYNYLFEGRWSRFLVTLQVEAGDRISVARAWGELRMPTAFMGFSGIDGTKVLDVTGVAEAVRRPRMVTLILDRSGSMTSNNGDEALPVAVDLFLSKFDPAGDNIGIYSYAAHGRREMFVTNLFWELGTNITRNAHNNSSVNLGGRGLKFGGNTGPDDAFRLAFEDMVQQNDEAFANPNVLKYIVFFTDGKFNTGRALFAHPGYTNIINGPPTASSDTFGSAVNTQPWQIFYSQDKDGTDTSIRFGNSHNINTNRTTPIGSTYYTNLDIILKLGVIGRRYRVQGNTDLTNVIEEHYAKLYFDGTNYTGEQIGRHSVQLNVGEYYMILNPGYTNLGGNIFRNWDDRSPRISWDPDTNRDGYPDVLFYDPNGNKNRWYPNGEIVTHDTNTYSVNRWANDPNRDVNGVHMNLWGYPGGGYISTNDVGKVYTNGWLFINTNGPMYENTALGVTASGGFHTAIETTNFNGYRYDWATNDPYDANASPWVPTAVSNAASGPYKDLPEAAKFKLGRVLVEYTGSTATFVVDDGGGTVTYTAGEVWTNIGVMNYCQWPTWRYDYKTDRWRESRNNNLDPDWLPKAYSNHAREMGVTMYTLGFAGADPRTLLEMANDQTDSSFNPTQPVGQYFYASTEDQIVTLLEEIAGKITAAITQ